MKFPHLFEFMDFDWLPNTLRDTMREILECGNTKPFRPYYSWVADEALCFAQEGGLRTIVELGAGSAPITRHMAEDPRSDGLSLVVCDFLPDRTAYEGLEKRYPGKVRARLDPVDFSLPQHWDPKTLLVLSGTFHHIPPEARLSVLSSMVNSADHLLVFEPLRKTLVSTLFMFGSIVPALILPLWFCTRPGRLRRFIWCWLLPVAPLLFWWDGLVTCMRLWSDEEWKRAIRQLSPPRQGAVRHSLFCQMVTV
jgi:hypothetical protein